MTTATTTGPASRRRSVRLLLVAGLLVAVALVALRLVDREPAPPTEPTGRSAVEAVLADEPDAQVVLPVELPPGYVFAGGDTASGGPGEVPVTAWVFRPVQPESGLAVVQLCVAPPTTCAATTEGVLSREADGLQVSVVPFGPDAGIARTLELWGDAELSGSWSSLAWLDEPVAAAPPRPTER